jgi:5-methylcytosine-specific restriction endonuclease McrA
MSSEHKPLTRSEKTAKWNRENPERYKANKARSRAKPEQRAKARDTSARWRRENPERHKSNVLKWHRDPKNAEQVKQQRATPEGRGRARLTAQKSYYKHQAKNLVRSRSAYRANMAKAIQYQAKYRAAHREALKAAARARQTPDRKAKRVAYTRARYYRNRAALLASRRAWYLAKADEIRAAKRLKLQTDPLARKRRDDSNRKWRQANPLEVQANRLKRRARLAGVGGTFTAAEWRAMLDRHDHLCFYCGEPGTMTQDHVIPIAKGGRHDAANIVPACKSCNASKGTGDWPKRVPPVPAPLDRDPLRDEVCIQSDIGGRFP